MNLSDTLKPEVNALAKSVTKQLLSNLHSLLDSEKIEMAIWDKVVDAAGVALNEESLFGFVMHEGELYLVIDLYPDSEKEGKTQIKFSELVWTKRLAGTTPSCLREASKFLAKIAEELDEEWKEQEDD